MEWFLGLAAAFGFFWWLGRPDATGQPSPLAHEVARRASDMNDPDGTFMDGYVAGRLTERAAARDAVERQRQRGDGLDSDDGLYSGAAGDGSDDWGMRDGMHEDMQDDDW